MKQTIIEHNIYMYMVDGVPVSHIDQINQQTLYTLTKL